MGGHDHHKPPYVVPDAKIYKIEDAPEMMAVQEKLAQQGLKDPWARNEVWRYDKRQWGTFGSRAFKLFSRGWKLGIPLFLLTIAVEKTFGFNQGHGHDHGHDKHDAKHGEHH